jgi:glycerate 2-kinase
MVLPQQSGAFKPSYEEGKRLAQHIFTRTLTAIDVRAAMLAKLKLEGGCLRAGEIVLPVDLEAHPPRVIALGKAASRMTSTFAEIMGGRLGPGVVVAPAEPVAKQPGLRYFAGGHPYPTQGSLDAAEAALDATTGLSAEDLVAFLISGGGSALFEKPLDPSISLADLVEFNRILVTSDLPIEQINVLRKHVSAVKGGRLGAHASPARQLTVFVSDVPEHLPSMVASGPTMPDESTVEECYAIATQHGLVARFPARIRQRFEEHTLDETPKPQDPRFLRSHYFCLLSNRDAVQAARQLAEECGFRAEIGSGNWDADYRQVADAALEALDALAQKHPGEPVCLVTGGEVTCPVTGGGMGGRNQALVLYAAEKIAGQPRVVLSAGTDGRDGNSPACGAVADGRTIARARALGLDPERYAANSDAYNFFRPLGDALTVGYTDNNVRDLRIWMHFGKG